MYILAVYNRLIFRDFESFLRSEVDLAEDDTILVLDDFYSSLWIWTRYLQFQRSFRSSFQLSSTWTWTI